MSRRRTTSARCAAAARAAARSTPIRPRTINVGDGGGGAIQLVSRTQITVIQNGEGTGVINVAAIAVAEGVALR